MLLTAVFTALS